MVFCLDNYTLAPFSYCLMKCEYSWTNDVKRGKLFISRFYDITHETVVTPATYFGILRKCSIQVFQVCWPCFFISFICIIGFKLTTHETSKNSQYSVKFTTNYRCLHKGVPYNTACLWLEHAKYQGSVLTINLYGSSSYH